MNRWYCNGQAIEHVPIDDRAFQYGDGLFETIAIRDGQPRLWNFHLDRLEQGCESLRFSRPVRKTLREWLDLAIRDGSAGARDATVKIILSAGLSERGYGRSTPSETTIYIGVFDAVTVAAEHYREGVDTVMCDTRLALFSATAGCKTLNRIEQVLARSEVVEHGAFEGLTLDGEGRLICGTMSNVFTISDESIATPSLERCGVEGVMRRHAITALQQRDRTVVVRDISASELLSADEVFLCNSQFGVIPVRSCGEKTWDVHPVTRSVMSVLADTGIAECEQ